MENQQNHVLGCVQHLVVVLFVKVNYFLFYLQWKRMTSCSYFWKQGIIITNSKSKKEEIPTFCQ